MMKKAFALTAAMFLAVGAFACSSSSSDAAIDDYTCPSVGSKACPNDDAVTQDDVDACNKCLSQSKDYAKCANAQGASISTKATCGSDGKTEQPPAPSADVQQKIQQNCASQLQAVITCSTS